MCGICGVVQLRGEPRAGRRARGPRPDDGRDDAPRAERPRHVRAPTASRSACADSASSTSRAATSRSPTRTAAIWAVQNGELYNHADIRGRLTATGTGSRRAATPRSSRTSTRTRAPRSRSSSAACSASRVWDAERAPGRARARPARASSRCTTPRSGDLLVFGSELKSVLASGLVDAELDYEAIDAFLTLGFVPGPMTPLAAVRKLMPGHVLVVDAKGVRERGVLVVPGAGAGRA